MVLAWQWPWQWPWQWSWQWEWPWQWEWDQYWQWLIVVSLFFVALERVLPWHRPHHTLRPGWLRDLLFLALNGHVFSLLLGGGMAVVFTEVVGWLQSVGFESEAAIGATWPLWVHGLGFFVLADLVQWCTHISLHKIPWLWKFHKVHHSIARLDWIANFHFHWFENLVYGVTQAIPLAWLGAPREVTLFVYVAGTFWGHFNHANIPVRIGALGYLFNSPHMHIWHHDASDEGGVSKNYGIVLSVWDWLFGTVHWPRDREPERLGYPGDREMPQHFGGQVLWPLSRWFSPPPDGGS